MAKNDNLKDFLTDVADAIREKKGTSDAINPQDFSAEIASIETGGGGSSMEYWKVPSLEIVAEYFQLIQLASLGKTQVNGVGATMAVPIAMAFDMGPILAFAWDNNLRIIESNHIFTLGEALTINGLNFEDAGFVKITEEEFYSIN